MTRDSFCQGAMVEPSHEEASWEAEEDVRARNPHLFE